ncbi:MAG TPA: hypothetical protein VLF91_05580 [Candidatus Saccharimonadales bacterium]|nr:hypothetical protein [Candidatus Saccharimonadales bacterium]
MKQKHFIWWITTAGIIGILFGLFYSIVGLEGLPIYQEFVPAASFQGWSRGLYGSVFIGFSVLLLLLGRRAIQKRDRELGKILFYGVAAWLAYEALISVVYGVYINVLVDIALVTFLGYPLLRSTRK